MFPHNKFIKTITDKLILKDILLSLPIHGILLLFKPLINLSGFFCYITNYVFEVTYYMKEIKLVIPTSLSEITLRDYQKIQAFQESNDNESQVEQFMVGVFCHLTDKEVRALDINDYDYIVSTLNHTLATKTILQHRFTMGDVEYGLIPNFDKMSFGEYIDLDTFIQEENSLHKAMSILFRPITHESHGKYRIAEYDVDKIDFDIMLNMTVDVLQGVLVFFYHLGNELVKVMPNYLQEELEKTTAYKQTLEGSGVGTPAFTDSPMGILNNLMKSQKLLSTIV